MKLLSFDADQTLIDFHSMREIALRAVVTKIRQLNAESTLFSARLTEIRDGIADRFIGQRVSMLELREMSFCEALKQENIREPGLARELMEIFRKLRFVPIYYPETLQVLRLLKKSCSMALITNGNSDPSKLGLGDYFDTIILGENYPFKKPDSRIFNELFKDLKVPKDNIYHIGDSLESDIQGANNVGINSVWINRDGSVNTTSIQPRYEISSLQEVVDVCGLHLRS